MSQCPTWEQFWATGRKWKTGKTKRFSFFLFLWKKKPVNLIPKKSTSYVVGVACMFACTFVPGCLEVSQQLLSLAYSFHGSPGVM